MRKLSPFTYLNITQFLGAFNDNVFRFLTAFFVISLLGSEKSGMIMASVAATFVMPFLLFTAAAGKLADRFSKRHITVLTKVMELVVMIMGTFFFAIGSISGAFVSLFLMTTQSTIFAPCKYGIVPELVPKQDVSKANGLLTALTYLSIILGTFFATWLTIKSANNFVISGLFCSFLSVVGLIASMCIPVTPAAGSTKKIHPFFLREIYKTLVKARSVKLLLTAVLCAGFFLFLGGFVQTNLIPFGIEFLDLSNDVQSGYLFLCYAVGIGIGSLIAGYLGKQSPQKIELALVPIGAFGIAFTFLLFSSFVHSITAIVVVLIFQGIFCGLFLIPLESFIQIFSPSKVRGQMIAASSFLGFFGVLIAAGVLMLFNAIGLTPLHGFQIMGFISLGVAVYTLIVMRYKLFSFINRILRKM